MLRVLTHGDAEEMSFDGAYFCRRGLLRGSTTSSASTVDCLRSSQTWADRRPSLAYWTLTKVSTRQI